MKINKTSYSVLLCSDIHAPFSHPDLVPFLAEIKRVYKPDLVCLSGDENDNHNMSFHDSDPDLDSAGRELERAIEVLKPLYKMFPDAYIMESNHGSMHLRKALAHGFPRAIIKSYNEILQAPVGWKWVPSLTFKTPQGLVYMCHGKSGIAGRLATMYGISCVQGHYHEKFQINYSSTPTNLIFDMHIGCLVDNKSLAMAYNKVNAKRPVIGCGVIVNGVPELLPMRLNSKGRWIGRL